MGVTPSEGFGEVAATIEPGNLEDLLHTAVAFESGDMNDHVNGFADERLDGFGGVGVHADKHCETIEAGFRVVGVQGGGTAFMTSIPSHQQIKRFGTAYLPHQD